MPAPRLPDSDMSAVSRAVAAPVDTFVRPRAVAETGGLFDLAKSLGTLAPTLGVLAADSNRLRSEKDDDGGRRAGAISQARSWGEAVERGEVQAGASPVFQRAWREVRGAARSAEYGTHIATAWNDPNNPLRNSDDPEAVNKWVAEQRRAFVAEMDADTQRGFLARAGEAEHRLVLQSTAQRTDRIERNAANDLGTLMVSTIEARLRAGASPTEAIAAAQVEATGLRFSGMAGDKVNDALGTAVLAVAQRTNRTDILEAATRPRPDVTRPGYTVAGLGGADWQLRLATATESIQSRRYTEESRRYELSERRGRAEASNAAAAFNQQVFAAATAGQPIPMPDAETLRRIGRYDPNFATSQIQLRASLLNLQRGEEDAGQRQQLPDIGRLRSELMAHPNPREHLNTLLIEGRLTDQRYLQDFSIVAERATEGRSFVLSMDGVMAQRQGFARGSAPEFSFDKPTFARANSIADQFFISEMTRWTVEYQNRNNGRMPTPEEATTKAGELRQLGEVFVQRHQANTGVLREDFWRPGQSLPMDAPATTAPAADTGTATGTGTGTRPPRASSPTNPGSRPPRAPPPAAGSTTPGGGDPVADYITEFTGKPFNPPPGGRRPDVSDIEALQRALMAPNGAAGRRVLDLFDNTYGRGAAAHYLSGNR